MSLVDAQTIVSERSTSPITNEHLSRLSVIGMRVLNDLFDRRPDVSGLYRDRLLLLALCQGGAQHFVDRTHGVKDLDLWAFFRAGPARPFPVRGCWKVDFGVSSLGRHPDDRAFEGRRVDVMGRSIDVRPDEDGIEAVRRWLQSTSTSAQHLRPRPVIAVTPTELHGRVIWSGTAGA